jgi:polyferredoxin
MQSLLSGYHHQFAFYVAGMLTVVGAAVGRFACGWLCPFGLIQELLGSLSRTKLRIPSVLKYLKYVFLALTLLLPVLWVGSSGVAEAYFCKYVCPAGTLEAGLPLGLGHPEVRSLLGALFSWKVGVLIFFIAASIISFRPFCRTTCPLGAFYALFNPVSLWRVEIRQDRCNDCGLCSQACPMDIDVASHPNSPECVRCLKCRDACPSGAMSFGCSGVSGKACREGGELI